MRTNQWTQILYWQQCVLVACLLFMICLMNSVLYAAHCPTIANHTVSKESILPSIPTQYITAVKQNLHIIYCCTSHSSQTVDGMRGLMEYKAGDWNLFGTTFDGEPQSDMLDIDYRPMSPVNVYGGVSHHSIDSLDSIGHTVAYFRETIKYLDHSDVNVVMCSKYEEDSQ